MSLWCEASHNYPNWFWSLPFRRKVYHFWSGNKEDKRVQKMGVQKMLFLRWSHFWMSPNGIKTKLKIVLNFQITKIESIFWVSLILSLFFSLDFLTRQGDFTFKSVEKTFLLFTSKLGGDYIILYFLMLMNTWQFHLWNWQVVDPAWDTSFICLHWITCLSFLSHTNLILLIAWNLLLLEFCFLFVCIIDQTQMYPHPSYH